MNSVKLFLGRHLYNAMIVLSVMLISFGSSNALSASKSADKKIEKVQKIHHVVRINKANAKDIADVLVGVGMKKAQAIVSWREANGRFRKVEHLARVKGISDKTIEKNRDRISL